MSIPEALKKAIGKLVEGNVNRLSVPAIERQLKALFITYFLLGHNAWRNKKPDPLPEIGELVQHNRTLEQLRDLLDDAPNTKHLLEQFCQLIYAAVQRHPLPTQPFELPTRDFFIFL